jgi:uncharacterized protein YbcV (DUF1398 family)
MQVICDLLDAALRGEIYFEELAKGLKEHQIDSLSFDFVTGEHRFYTHDNQVFNHHSPYEPGYPISKVFNKEGVVAALEAFDKRKVTAVEFHKALAEAGVCFARCFEKVNRAIYMSQSGETYLEQW